MVAFASLAAKALSAAKGKSGAFSKALTAAKGKTSSLSNLAKGKMGNFRSQLTSGLDAMSQSDDGSYEAAEPMYDDAAQYGPPASSGTKLSTWVLIIDVIFLLIGVILIMASQTKCKDDPNSSACKTHKQWGIGFLVVCTLIFLVVGYFKWFKK